MVQSSPQSQRQRLEEFSDLELARALAERLAIAPNDWHRLKGNRKAQAAQQATAAIVFLLEARPEEALLRLQQASGWLDHTLSAPPCPTHGKKAADTDGASLKS